MEEGDFEKEKIHHGGLILHNLSLFDRTLKLRFVKSKSKWTVFPNISDLSDVVEATSNTFWQDVISVSYL